MLNTRRPISAFGGCLVPLAALAIVWSATVAVSGQERPDAPRETQAGDDDRFEIQIARGTTIKDYIDQLKSNLQTRPHGPEDLNFVVTDEAANYQLPEIDVFTNIEGALGVLESCSTDRAEIFIDQDPTGSVRIVRLREHAPPATIRVINVGSILKTSSHDDFISAIGIGLEMAGGENSGVSMKLHEETGLFFVKGPTMHIEVIEQIINELQRVAAFSQPSRSGGGTGGDGGRTGGGTGGDAGGGPAAESQQSPDPR